MQVQIQKNLREEPAIKSVVGLVLHFDKHNRSFGRFRWRRQHPIQAERRLFDLFRPESITCHIGRRPARQFEHQFRQALE